MCRTLLIGCATMLLVAGLAEADSVLYLSTRAPNTIAGQAFEEGDVVAYNMDTGAASLFLRGDNIFRGSNGSLLANGGGTENINAMVVLSSTTILLSTNDDARLGKPAQLGGTLHFYPGDVVLYDMVNDTAVLLFDGDLNHFRTSGGAFGPDENIDAFGILPNGHYLISTNGDARLGKPTQPGGTLLFHKGDVVEYDPVNDTAVIYFSQGLFRESDGDFGNPRNVDGVAINPWTGNLLLSTDTDGTDKSRLGDPWLGFSDGDIVDYDMFNDTATLFFDQSLFLTHCDNDDVDAFDVIMVGYSTQEIPEPLTVAGAFMALTGLGAYLRRRRLSLPR